MTEERLRELEAIGPADATAEMVRELCVEVRGYRNRLAPEPAYVICGQVGCSTRADLTVTPHSYPFSDLGPLAADGWGFAAGVGWLCGEHFRRYCETPPACARCGQPVPHAVAEPGADGEKLYHPACWRIVTREGE